jgi:SAM-dependent methyltransferase
MNKSEKHFKNSLDITSDGIDPFIPYILKDLWELGSNPKYMIQLLDRQRIQSEIKTVADFGCGKGAVLIQLASEFSLDGIGIDIVPGFIEDATRIATARNVSAKLKFICGDIKEQVNLLKDMDLIIYGHDSEVLGNVKESLLTLKNCSEKKGYILLETTHTRNENDRIDDLPSEDELDTMIRDSGMQVLDKIFWDNAYITQTNLDAIEKITSRINELIVSHPENKEQFIDYLASQRTENAILENQTICTTWLLRHS